MTELYNLLKQLSFRPKQTQPFHSKNVSYQDWPPDMKIRSIRFLCPPKKEVKPHAWLTRIQVHYRQHYYKIIGLNKSSQTRHPRSRLTWVKPRMTMKTQTSTKTNFLTAHNTSKRPIRCARPTKYSNRFSWTKFNIHISPNRRIKTWSTAQA